jgi:hypothetical protein
MTAIADRAAVALEFVTRPCPPDACVLRVVATKTRPGQFTICGVGESRPQRFVCSCARRAASGLERDERQQERREAAADHEVGNRSACEPQQVIGRHDRQHLPEVRLRGLRARNAPACCNSSSHTVRSHGLGLEIDLQHDFVARRAPSLSCAGMVRLRRLAFENAELGPFGASKDSPDVDGLRGNLAARCRPRAAGRASAKLVGHGEGPGLKDRCCGFTRGRAACRADRLFSSAYKSSLAAHVAVAPTDENLRTVRRPPHAL